MALVNVVNMVRELVRSSYVTIFRLFHGEEVM
jgi:hypothetical protein